MDLVKVSKIQMYFWFGVTVITLIMVVILYAQDAIETWYFSMPVICLVLGFLRRWQYKRLSKSKAEKEAREKKEKSK
ncbi:MAG: hypothetical protein WDZ35_15675 [Crocinitomicaceae bacterium]